MHVGQQSHDQNEESRAVMGVDFANRNGKNDKEQNTMLAETWKEQSRCVIASRSSELLVKWMLDFSKVSAQSCCRMTQ